MMEIADFTAVSPIKLIGACFLISVFHIDLNFGHTAIHNGRLCNHKHPKSHDVSVKKTLPSAAIFSSIPMLTTHKSFDALFTVAYLVNTIYQFDRKVWGNENNITIRERENKNSIETTSQMYLYIICTYPRTVKRN